MPLTLPQLERHLFAAAVLRGKRDASEFKGSVSGVLVPKCNSDVFEERYEAVLQRELDRGRERRRGREVGELCRSRTTSCLEGRSDAHWMAGQPSGTQGLCSPVRPPDFHRSGLVSWLAPVRLRRRTAAR